jgi:predicted nucleotidyltransferase
MIVPEMGGRSGKGRRGLADALFTPVQQRVLGLLFGQPDRAFPSAELIRRVGSGTGAVHRQLARLEEVGLVTVERVGNQKLYQARRESPVFEELRSLIVKTAGVAGPLREALLPHADGMEAAFIYGSVAKGTDKAGSDVDLMVISDSLTYPDLFDSLQSAEAQLGRKVDPRVMTTDEWRSRRRRSTSFASRVAGQPRIILIGRDVDVG